MLKIDITNIKQKLELLAAAQSQMVTRLAYAIAIGRDAVLQQYLRKLASGDQGQPFLVSQLKRQAWLRVDRDGTSLHREPPPGLSSIDLDEALETKPLLAQALDVAISATNAIEAAVDLLRPVFEPFPMMSRSEFQAVFGWVPLLEHLAYRSAMRALHVIDALRPTVRHDLGKQRDPNSEALETYWKLIHSIGQLTLLASHSEARAWLSEMASGFVWETWTPTLILTRERTSWLGAVAAKAAIAFGETAVESYLRKLAQTEHPMMAFDALFGLSAIALANPRSTGSILNEILAGKEAHLARAKAYAGYLSVVYESAARVLSGPPADKGAFHKLDRRVGSAQGMATRATLFRDMTTLSASGDYLGFLMLHFVTESPQEALFAKGLTSSPRYLSRNNISAAFRRAWEVEPARRLN